MNLFSPRMKIKTTSKCILPKGGGAFLDKINQEASSLNNNESIEEKEEKWFPRKYF
jgi:hypothetical protein